MAFRFFVSQMITQCTEELIAVIFKTKCLALPSDTTAYIFEVEPNNKRMKKSAKYDQD